MLNFVRVDTPQHPLTPVARELFIEYSVELRVDLCFQGFEKELADLPGKYGPPTGILYVVLDGDQPIACGALHALDPDICELKRIYVRPPHRSAGLGRQITVDLIERATELGYKAVRLDTLRRLGPANKLYQSLGFTEIEPYNYNPEDDIVYFEKRLL